MYLNSHIRTYPFTEIGTTANAKYSPPANLLVLIPGGSESFQVAMPNAPSFAWVANVKAGTEILFDMNDNQGNQGQWLLWTCEIVSHIPLQGGVAPNTYTIQNGDSTCDLHTSGQTSSSASPGATGTSQPSPTSGGGIGTAAIIGIAAGGLGVAVLIGVLVFLLMKKRNNDRKRYKDKPLNLLSYESTPGGGYSDNDRYDPYPVMDAPYTPRPFTESRSTSDYSTSYGGSHSSSKHRNGPGYAPAPVIQHADIADPEPEPEVPMELPPQYSMGRAPLEQFSALSDYPPSSSSGSASGSGSASTGAPGSRRINSMRKGPPR